MFGALNHYNSKSNCANFIPSKYSEEMKLIKVNCPRSHNYYVAKKCFKFRQSDSGACPLHGLCFMDFPLLEENNSWGHLSAVITLTSMTVIL